MKRRGHAFTGWVLGLTILLFAALVAFQTIREAVQVETASFVCKYIGEGEGLVTQNPFGMMKFSKTGARDGNWHADRTVGCPNRSGWVDTAHPACNTVAEVLAAINHEGSNWYCAEAGVAR